MADFNFFLNRQGVRGNKGEQGEQGYSPRITVKTETAAEYVLKVQNEDGSFDTPNLRGNAIENLGGTYVRFDQDTEQMYTGYADTASTTSQGEVVLSTYVDLANGGDESEVTTSKDVHDFVEAKISEASVNYVDIDDYTQKMGELDGEISDLDDNKLDFADLSNALVAGTNITITPNAQTGKITIAGEPVSQAQADWNQDDTSAPDYIKNKPTIPEAITVDDDFSTTSTNPVENRLITNAINLISNELEDFAEKDLSNLSTDGEARLHALKAYSDNGEILTDANGLSNVISYAHSTFDSTNVVKVNSPTVTNDGIASGFSANDYIEKTFSESIDIINNVYVIKCMGIYDSNARHGILARFGRMWIGDDTGNGIIRLQAQAPGGVSTNLARVEVPQLQNGDKLYITAWCGGNPRVQGISVSINGGRAINGIDVGGVINTSAPATTRLSVGTDYGNASNYTEWDIDLKYVSILKNNDVLFGYNKTGTDTYTINSSTVTIPYTESITGSKIAPASSRQDIATVAAALGSANYYTLDEVNGNFTLPQVELYGLIERATSTIPSGVVQSTSITNIIPLTQAEYDLIVPESDTLYIITPSS